MHSESEDQPPAAMVAANRFPTGLGRLLGGIGTTVFMIAGVMAIMIWHTGETLRRSISCRLGKTFNAEKEDPLALNFDRKPK